MIVKVIGFVVPTKETMLEGTLLILERYLKKSEMPSRKERVTFDGAGLLPLS